MQYLSISQPQESFTEDQYPLLVEVEVWRARELYVEGAKRQLWHRADAPGVCILWEAERAGEILKTFPLTRAGIIESSLIRLKPRIGFGPG